MESDSDLARYEKKRVQWAEYTSARDKALKYEDEFSKRFLNGGQVSRKERERLEYYQNLAAYKLDRFEENFPADRPVRPPMPPRPERRAAPAVLPSRAEGRRLREEEQRDRDEVKRALKMIEDYKERQRREERRQELREHTAQYVDWNPFSQEMDDRAPDPDQTALDLEDIRKERPLSDSNFRLHDPPRQELVARHTVVPPVEAPLYDRPIANQRGAQCGFHSVINILRSDPSVPQRCVEDGPGEWDQVNVVSFFFEERVRYYEESPGERMLMHPRAEMIEDGEPWNLESEGVYDMNAEMEALGFLQDLDQIMVDMLMEYYGYSISTKFSNNEDAFDTMTVDYLKGILQDKDFAGIIHGGIGHWQALVRRNGFFYDLDSQSQGRTLGGVDERVVPMGPEKAAEKLLQSYGGAKRQYDENRKGTYQGGERAYTVYGKANLTPRQRGLIFHEQRGKRDETRIREIVRNFLGTRFGAPQLRGMESSWNPFDSDDEENISPGRKHVRIMLGGWEHRDPYPGFEDVVFIVYPREAKKRGANHIGVNWREDGALFRVLENYLTNIESKHPDATVIVTLATDFGSGSWLRYPEPMDGIVRFLLKHTNVTFVTEDGGRDVNSTAASIKFGLEKARARGWKALATPRYHLYTDGSYVGTDIRYVFTTLDSRVPPREIQEAETEAWLQKQRSKKNRSISRWDWWQRSRQEQVPEDLMLFTQGLPMEAEEEKLRQLYLAFGDPEQF